MINRSTDKFIALILVGLVVGWLGAKQFFILPQVKKITQGEEAQVLAVETGELYRANQQLRAEIVQLEAQKSKLATTSPTESEEALQSAIGQLSIIAGQKAVTGPGVMINFNQPLQTTDLVDLVNALRNIGAEAIALNDHRVTGTTGLRDEAKVSIVVIGDQELLAEALSRKGGVLEQMNVIYSLEKKPSVEIPAVSQ